MMEEVNALRKLQSQMEEELDGLRPSHGDRR